MSFISTTRIYTKRAYLSTWQLYFFDLLVVAAVWGAYDSVPFLLSFDSKAALVAGPRLAVNVLGGLGMGGVRLSMYIAIFRKNRAPQRLEWITCLGGLAIIFTFSIFGGALLNVWAEAHGYRRCPTDESGNGKALFSRTGTSCPVS